VWVPETEFQNDMAFASANQWQDISRDQLPATLDGDPVMAADGFLIAFNSETGELALFTRKKDDLTKRGTIRPYKVQGPTHHRLSLDDDAKSVQIEVRAKSDSLQYSVCLTSNGLFEFKPAQVQAITIADSRLAYALVPSMIGTDLVYDAAEFENHRGLYVPSMNMIVGLVGGNDAMMVGIWPPGQQLARLELAHVDGHRTIDAISIALAENSFYLRYLEHPGIWHDEVLKPDYLEKDSQISWKPPFPAKWIGYFFVESEDVSYPFYFHHKKEKIWGRYIRSWYQYPCWFENNRTYVHFEKKFPPIGKMLLYFLDRHSNAQEDASPFQAMKEALGQDLAAKLLDLDGVDQRPLLAHGDAVCAMTRKTQEIIEAGEEVRRRTEIESWADDIADFIGMIRDRIFEYRDFANRMTDSLEAKKRGNQELGEVLEPLLSTLETIALAAEEDLPDVSLVEVRRWAEEIKGLTQAVRPDNLERFKVLSRQCRQVAGSQDDLARELSVLTIRLMQEAAVMGVDSPERARLAEEIIGQCRGILRRPTWWEPRRYYLPKPDPGIP
jgi:hypothetical protein